MRREKEKLLLFLEKDEIRKIWKRRTRPLFLRRATYRFVFCRPCRHRAFVYGEPCFLSPGYSSPRNTQDGNAKTIIINAGIKWNRAEMKYLQQIPVPSVFSQGSVREGNDTLDRYWGGPSKLFSNGWFPPPPPSLPDSHPRSCDYRVAECFSCWW